MYKTSTAPHDSHVNCIHFHSACRLSVHDSFYFDMFLSMHCMKSISCADECFQPSIKARNAVIAQVVLEVSVSSAYAHRAILSEKYTLLLVFLVDFMSSSRYNYNVGNFHSCGLKVSCCAGADNLSHCPTVRCNRLKMVWSCTV